MQVASWSSRLNSFNAHEAGCSWPVVFDVSSHHRPCGSMHLELASYCGRAGGSRITCNAMIVFTRSVLRCLTRLFGGVIHCCARGLRTLKQQRPPFQRIRDENGASELGRKALRILIYRFSVYLPSCWLVLSRFLTFDPIALTRTLFCQHHGS